MPPITENTYDFSALLDDLAKVQAGTEDMAKSMKTDGAEDDAKIAAAADTDGDGKAEGAAEADAGGGDEGDEKGKGEDADNGDADYFGKSFQVTLEDGTTAEAYDGTAAIEALTARMDKMTAQLDGMTAGGAMAKALGADMAKALGSVTGTMKGLQEIVTKQGELIKSMAGDITALRGSGTGRKAVLDVHEQRSAAPPKAEGLTPEQVMTKAMDAQMAGRITALDVSRMESRLGRGEPIPADLLAKIA